jgi:hypothetical protein
MFEPVTSNFSSFTGSEPLVEEFWAKPMATEAKAAKPKRAVADGTFSMVLGRFWYAPAETDDPPGEDNDGEVHTDFPYVRKCESGFAAGCKGVADTTV